MAAAYLHGLAARLAAEPSEPAGRPTVRRQRGEGHGQAPIGASDVVRALPAAFRSL